MGRDTRMKVMLGTLVLLLTLMELTFPRLTKGEENYIKSYAMNDPYNIRKLENGEYLYRIGKDLRSNAVYWARMGNSKNMIVTVPSASHLIRNEGIEEAVMTVAKLPKGFGGCDWDGTHTARVTIIPEDFKTIVGEEPDMFRPVYGTGEITFNRYGRGPTVLRSITDNIEEIMTFGDVTVRRYNDLYRN